MRTSRTIVIVAAVLVVAACRDHETPTGGYGVQGVSGVVTMAVGMSNSNPAGVRVTVRGTGMSALLGTDGHFSFFGVPPTVELLFARDDVDARIRVTPSPAPLQIELNSNGASIGRRRAAPSDPLLQVEGLITKVSDMEITVHDSHDQDVTAKITADTEAVEDLADRLDVLERERCRGLEVRRERRPHARRRLLEREHDRERLLPLHEVVHLELAGALGARPDPEQVVVRLERLAEVVAETRERGPDLGVVRCEHRRTLGGGGDERACLLRDHRAVALDAHVGTVLEADVQELTLAEADAGAVDEVREVQDAHGREAPLAQPLYRQA